MHMHFACHRASAGGNSMKGVVLGNEDGDRRTDEPAAITRKQSFPPCLSTEGHMFHRREVLSGDDLYIDNLDLVDFSNVFGGPPRRIHFRQLATGYPLTSLFYERIFCPHEVDQATEIMLGRRLPEFKIPVRSCSEHEQRNSQFDGFDDDTREWEDQTVVEPRSSFTMVLSSEELILPSAADSSGSSEDCVSPFPAELRSTNQRKTISLMAKEANQREQNIPPLAGNQQIYSTDSEDDCCSENLGNYPFGSSRKKATPETLSIGEFEVDFELNSQASIYYPSFHSDQRQKTSTREEDETNSPIVTQTSSDGRREACEPSDIDEAISWAKQKFQTHCPGARKWGIQESDQEKPTEETASRSSHSDGTADSHGSQNKSGIEEETKQLQVLDEKIRIWSTGKEADIRLLLSTLHHILGPSSGWLAISLTNIIQRAQVKKAYQKARLCLHPDKLQQRDATLAQKYIAEKAFSILQDAWAAFISLQVC